MLYYYLKTENNVITDITTGPFDLNPEGNWIRWKNVDDFTDKIEKPRIGYILDLSLNASYPPQPYPSWKLENGRWVPPVDFPKNLENYMWNEINKSWDLK